MDQFGQIIEIKIKKGFTYKQVSQILHSYGVAKCSEMTVRRYVTEHGISRRQRITDEELYSAVTDAVTEVGPTYGRKMLKGHLESKGIQAGEVRIGQALRTCTPAYHRERQQGARNLNIVPYSAEYYGDKLHMDQNEKLTMFGVTHVLAVDGYSRRIVGWGSMELKNNLKIYEQVFRPTLLEEGIWNQVRVDKGTEFYLCLYIQEINSHKRRNINKLSYRQTTSTENHVVERMWPEVNNRVNYPIKEALVALVNQDELDMTDNIHRYCTSSLALQLCEVGMKRVVSSWNAHAISRRGVPNQLSVPSMTKAITDLPNPEAAAAMYQRDVGGQLRAESHFADCPFPNPGTLEACQARFQEMYPSMADLFEATVHRQYQHLQDALLQLITLTETYC